MYSSEKMEISKGDNKNNGVSAKRVTITSLLKNSRGIDAEPTENTNKNNNSSDRTRGSSTENSSITSQARHESDVSKLQQKCENLASYSPGNAHDPIATHPMQRTRSSHASMPRRMPETHQTMYRHFTMLYECNICKSIFRSFELFSHHKINGCFDKRHQIAIHNSYQQQQQFEQANHAHSQVMQPHGYGQSTNIPYFPTQQQHYMAHHGNHGRVNSAGNSRRTSVHLNDRTNSMLGRSHSFPYLNKDYVHCAISDLNAAKSSKYETMSRNHLHRQQNDNGKSDENEIQNSNGDSLTNKRKCEFCDHYFGKVSSLRKHIETCHRQDLAASTKDKLTLPDQESERSRDDLEEVREIVKSGSEKSASSQMDEDETSEELDELKLEVDEESPKIEMTSIFN